MSALGRGEGEEKKIARNIDQEIVNSLKIKVK